jgi:4-hydroxy-3-polyprenylbenzoate decarboxylase/2,5-furandicarboxylate decarboxylase 1
VKCKTVDLEVSATAEVSPNFEVDLRKELLEGPLREYTGYYTPASKKPTARITAITHRRQPYFQGLLTGKPVTENHVLREIAYEASLLRALKVQLFVIRRLVSEAIL